VANIVTHGLGQPDEGAVVLGGLGTTAPAPPGSMSATLAGSGSLAGSLTATTTQPNIGARPPRQRLLTRDDDLVIALLDDELLLV
jgi:hypothetical protein